MCKRAALFHWGFAIVATFGLAGVAQAGSSYIVGSFSSPTLYDINIKTGAISNPRPLTPAPVALAGLSFSPTTGQLYGLVYTANSTSAAALARIDPATGQTTIVGSLGLSDVYEGDIDFDPADGKLYGVQQVPTGAGSYMFEIDTQTGAASNPVLLQAAADSDISGMCFADDGSVMALDTSPARQSGGPGGSWFWKLDPATGARLALYNTYVIDTWPAGGVAFDPLELLYAVVGSTNPSEGSRLYWQTMNSSGAQLVANISSVDDLSAIAIVRVPEPATAFLIPASFLFLARGRRRGADSGTTRQNSSKA